ncbi:MAG: hypothetical protein ACRDDA_14010 [Aeromonas sp.]
MGLLNDVPSDVFAGNGAYDKSSFQITKPFTPPSGFLRHDPHPFI